MTAPEDGRELVRRALLDRAVKLGAGVDRRGRPLAWSLDCRELTLDATLLPAIAELLWPAVSRHMPAVIAGPTVSAAPLVSALLVVAAREGHEANGALVRRTAKPYGLRKLIEGPPLAPGARAVVVDDILAHGSSIVRTRAALRSAGAVPVAAVTLVDLETPASIRAGDLDYTGAFGASELGLAPPAPPARTAPAAPFREVEWLCASVRGAEVLTVSRDGLLSASDVVTGRMRWTASLDRPVRAAAIGASSDRVVVATAHDGQALDLTVLTPDGGGPIARRALGGRGAPLDVVADDAAVIVATTRSVYSVLPDLEPQWGRRWSVHSGAMPSPGRDAIYVLADHSLLALDAADGSTRWARPVLGRKSAQIAVTEAGAIVASEITVAAFDPLGSVRWLRSLGARVMAGPVAAAHDLVAVRTHGGALHLLRAADGSVAHSWALGEEHAFRRIAAGPGLLVLLDPRSGATCLPVEQLLETAVAAGVG
jgi:orotate phosphoribosyltransferase